MPPELGPASSLLDPLRDHALAGTCGDAQLGRALAPGSSSLASLAPSKVKDRGRVPAELVARFKAATGQ
jgi:hypothetical protein